MRDILATVKVSVLPTGFALDRKPDSGYHVTPCGQSIWAVFPMTPTSFSSSVFFFADHDGKYGTRFPLALTLASVLCLGVPWLCLASPLTQCHLLHVFYKVLNFWSIDGPFLCATGGGYTALNHPSKTRNL